MMFGTIWGMGADAFAQNTAAQAMVYIMFYAIGTSLLTGIASIFGKTKLAITSMIALGAMACLYIFIREAVKIVDYAGKVLGL